MAISTRFYPGQKDYIEQLNLVDDALTASGVGGVFSSSVFAIKDSTDASKIAKFDVSSIPTGTTRTFVVPNLAGAIFATTSNLAQTFLGVTSFASNLLRSLQTTISAAGTNQGTATALTKDSNIVTTVASGTGVILPTAAAGMTVFIKNAGANALAVYPASGGAIDALAANAAYSIPVGETRSYTASSTTQWFTHSSGSGDLITSAVQTITGAKSFNNNTFKLNGSTSGTATLNAPAVAGTAVSVLPASGGTLLSATDIVNDITTGGTNVPLSAQQALVLAGLSADRIRYGNGAPASGLGNDGDAYSRLDSPFVGTIYKKTAGTWALAQLATTWAARPVPASSYPGAVITISDWGHDFYSDNTNWVAMGKRVKIDSFMATSYPSRTTGTAASQAVRTLVMPSGLVYAGCMLHLSWLIDFQGTGATSKQVILDDTLVGTPFIVNAVGMNANIKLWGDKKTIRYAASNLLYALPSGQTSDVTPAAGLSSAITTITSANYITSAHSWRLRTISPTDDQWQLLDWTAWVEFP
jgi:hypothetical protein